MNRWLARVILATWMAVPASIAVALPAAANPPEFVDEDEADSTSCPFLVYQTFSGQRQTIDRSDGSTITIYNLTVTATNQETGKTVTAPWRGTVQHFPRPDGTTLVRYTGLNVLFNTDAGPGQDYAVGTVTVVRDANGNVLIPLSGRGKIIDMCEVLD